MVKSLRMLSGPLLAFSCPNDSIAREGRLQPILVRPVGARMRARWQIIFGHGPVAALRQLRREAIPYGAFADRDGAVPPGPKRTECCPNVLRANNHLPGGSLHAESAE